MKISATVITLNEEERLPECLKSLQWCDEIIVLDSGSSDRTEQVAKEHGALFYGRQFDNYGNQKNAAAALAANDWIINVDADERVSSKLADEIRRCPGTRSAYCVDRRSLFMGGPARSARKAGRDLPVRLYDRRVAQFTPALVHERVDADSVGRLRGVLLHDGFRNLYDMAARLNKYSSLYIAEKPASPSTLRLVIRPLLHFFWILLRHKAILDGARGFIFAWMWAHHDLLMEAKRFETRYEATITDLALPTGIITTV